MGDYKDTEAVIKAIDKIARSGGIGINTMARWVTEQAIEAVKCLPSADVKPVVRCEDCGHGYDDIGGIRCTHGVCVDCIVESDFYCAYGERGNDNEHID